MKIRKSKGVTKVNKGQFYFNFNPTDRKKSVVIDTKETLQISDIYINVESREIGRGFPSININVYKDGEDLGSILHGDLYQHAHYGYVVATVPEGHRVKIILRNKGLTLKALVNLELSQRRK